MKTSRKNQNHSAHPYDKLIKECLTESLSGILANVLHIDVKETTLLDSKLQATEEGEADLLVEEILRRLQNKVKEEIRLSKYIKQLEILSQLRDLQKVVYQKRNAIDIMYDIKKDPAYQRGEEEGEKRGERIGEEKGEFKKAVTIAKAMKRAGEPVEKIAQYTGLSVEQINKLKV